jgi:hypothetical protein
LVNFNFIDLLLENGQEQCGPLALTGSIESTCGSLNRDPRKKTVPHQTGWGKRSFGDTPKRRLKTAPGLRRQRDLTALIGTDRWPEATL